MNNNERSLLRYICEGDMKKSQQQARIILNSITSQTDQNFKANLLNTLNQKENKFIELPYNLQELLIAEDASNFPLDRFILREGEATIVNKVLSTRKAAQKLEELGISYSPSLLLHGDSGCGKTMLAKYIAHKAELPFIYVRFSNVVSSYLGSTQSNIGKIFEYARTEPCVLCFDEIDAVGMERGQKSDVGEINRIVIALMQELDRLPNGVIIIGTTNRYDRLDKALVRRFSLSHKVRAFSESDSKALAEKFFDHAGIDTADWFDEWLEKELSVQPSKMINNCTEKAVEIVLRECDLCEDKVSQNETLNAKVD